MLKFFVYRLAFLSILIGACGPPPTPVPPPTPTVTPRPTATSRPTPTATPISKCPAPNPAAVWIAPVDFNGYPEAIRAYLNAGGSPVELTTILRNASSINDQWGGVKPIDLTGDGERETIVSIYTPGTLDRSPAPGGMLLIYGCAQRQVALVGQRAAGPSAAETLPRLAQVGNIIGAARGAQLATLTSTCGASTCFDRFDVLGWNGEQFVSLMSAPLQLPSGAFRLVQLDQDPAFEIEAQGGVIGSVGAGPQRAEKQVWKWNGAQYVRISTELSPVKYRIHAVYEGDDALAGGNYAKAIEWYSRVITDDALKDWHAEIGYRTQTDRATLTAYARFRLLVIGVGRGDANARDQLDQLTAQFPGGAPAHLTQQLAQVFWNQYQATHDLVAACAAANAYANSGDNNQYLIVDDLNLFGYANRTYTSDDMCPIKG